MINDETFNEFVIRILLTVNPPESEKTDKFLRGSF